MAQELGLFVEIYPKLLQIWGNYLLNSGYINYFKIIDELIPPEYSRGGEILNIRNFSVSEKLISKSIKFMSIGENKFKIYLGNKIYEGQVGKQLNFIG